MEKNQKIYTEDEVQDLVKKAMIGEMIDLIAHQWTHPLSTIALYSELILYDFDSGIVDKEYLTNYFNKISSQIDHLTESLNEFRTFLSPEKEKSSFSIRDIIDAIKIILEDTLKGNQISLRVSDGDFQVVGYPNELKQALLNIILNAKQIFQERKIKNREIVIEILETQQTILIQDNAGGINKDVIDKIFNKNMTTRKNSGGSGIGLYISRQILAKIGALISVKNIEGGLEFRIDF